MPKFNLTLNPTLRNTALLISTVLIFGQTDAQNMAKSRSGSFQSLHAPTKGTVKLAQNAAGRWTLTVSNLKTEAAPDLKIWLMTQKVVKDTPEIKKNNPIDLGIIATTLKSKTFILPANIKAEQIQNVVLWRDQFRVVFATAALN